MLISTVKTGTAQSPDAQKNHFWQVSDLLYLQQQFALVNQQNNSLQCFVFPEEYSTGDIRGRLSYVMTKRQKC